MYNGIRIAPNQLYTKEIQFSQDIQNQSTLRFGELMTDATPVLEQNQKNTINLSSLGAPAGFCADISMLNKEDADALGIIEINRSNPYLM